MEDSQVIDNTYRHPCGVSLDDLRSLSTNERIALSMFATLTLKRWFNDKIQSSGLTTRTKTRLKRFDLGRDFGSRDVLSRILENEVLCSNAAISRSLFRPKSISITKHSINGYYDLYTSDINAIYAYFINTIWTNLLQKVPYLARYAAPDILVQDPYTSNTGLRGSYDIIITIGSIPVENTKLEILLNKYLGSINRKKIVPVTLHWSFTDIEKTAVIISTKIIPFVGYDPAVTIPRISNLFANYDVPVRSQVVPGSGAYCPITNNMVPFATELFTSLEEIEKIFKNIFRIVYLDYV